MVRTQSDFYVMLSKMKKICFLSEFMEHLDDALNHMNSFLVVLRGAGSWTL